MIDVSKLPQEEREVILARRAYRKKWNKMNADKIREYNKRFYTKQMKKNAE